METKWHILNSALVWEAEQGSFPFALSVDRSLELIFALVTKGQIVGPGAADRCLRMVVEDPL